MTHKSFIVSLLAVILFVLTGCSSASTISGNGDDTMALTGYWVYQESGESDYFHFDGKGNGFEAMIYQGSFIGSVDYRYSIDDNQVRLFADGETIYWNIVDMDNSELCVEIDGSQYRLSKISEQDYNSAKSQANTADGGGYYDENQWAAEEARRQAEQAAQQAQQAAEQAGQQAMQAAQPMY